MQFSELMLSNIQSFEGVCGPVFNIQTGVSSEKMELLLIGKSYLRISYRILRKKNVSSLNIESKTEMFAKRDIIFNMVKS
jgi:hypothetical protein